MLLLWTKCCGVWLLASAAVRGVRAVALVPDRARSAAGAPVRGGRCRRSGVGGGPYKCCSRWNIGWCRVHLLTRCNCGASGAVRAEPILLSGRWQAPAAVLPEGPKNPRIGHTRARRARELPKHASPRARRARGRAKLSHRFGACQCYYMFFSTQPKIAIFEAQLSYLNYGQNA